MTVPTTGALDAFLDAHGEELIAFRRRLHAHPELSWEEHETTAAVAARLDDRGRRFLAGAGGARGPG